MIVELSRWRDCLSESENFKNCVVPEATCHTKLDARALLRHPSLRGFLDNRLPAG